MNRIGPTPGWQAKPSLSILLVVAMILMLDHSACAAADTDELKAQAYSAYTRRAFPEAAALFQEYLAAKPEDLQASLAYADILISQDLQAEAVAWLETVHLRFPAHEPAYFQLGLAYLRLQRPQDAERVFLGLQQSANADLARAATEALHRARADRDRAARLEAESQIYDAAAKNQHDEVIARVERLAQRWPLSYAMELQRLYALYQLKEFDRALALAQPLAQLHPRAADLAFLRAELFVQTKQFAQATNLWRQIESQFPNSPEAATARQRRLVFEPPPSTVPAAPPFTAVTAEESRVFNLARELKHREVVDAINALEKKEGRVSWPLELQRLYALFNLHQFSEVHARAQTLATNRLQDVDLAFLQAETLVRLNRTSDAIALWRRVEAQNVGTPVAAEAARRRRAYEQPPSPPPWQPTAEDRIYDLAKAGQHQQVVDVIDALELKQGQLSWPMELQRLYALQLAGNLDRALPLANALAESHPQATDLSLLRADLLIQARLYPEANVLLQQLRRDYPNQPPDHEALRRLQSLPVRYRTDKVFWGEAYLSGDYYGRFGGVAGTGLARHGWFVPGARWLQPYLEFRFGVDTESGLPGERTIIADNHVGFYGGLRAQLLPNEFLYAYAQGGVNKDLLDDWKDGDWSYDYQAGAYAFKNWGPGITLESKPPPPTGTDAAPVSDSPEAGAWDYWWRGDWFLDAGADFSYYHRYASAIGYGLAREGFRLFQVGPRLTCDAYLVQNFSWDIKGNYFDNLIEVGPGVRWIWKPCRLAEVLCRLEWLNGFYTGRDDLDNRGDTDSHYDEIHVGLVVGMRW